MRSPDKWIRKAVSDAIKDAGVGVKVYDTFTPNNDKAFILLSTQTGELKDQSKCGQGWESTILIDVVTRVNLSTGSRVQADDIAEKVMNACAGLQVEHFTVNSQQLSMPNDISTQNTTETIHRKLIRYTLKLFENE